MYIVIFPILFMLGKYVYNNYLDKKTNASSNDDVANGETSDRQRALDDNRVEVFDDTRFMPLAEVSETVKFWPPAYMQRYLAVANVLSNPKYATKLRKIVDFGCAELGFLPYLKSLEGVEEILFVDMDRQVLLQHYAKAAPLVSDHLQKRSSSLKIEICVGNVVYNDKKLEKTDAVVCIELIEHLYDYILLGFPTNIFGYIKPKVAIITTPNAEFNALFPNLADGGMRHPDHKFEWTRREFEDWARNIVRKYPYYSVSFEGICYGPEHTRHLGACSQMAIFERNDDSCTLAIEVPGIEGFYQTIETYIYPFTPDKRTDSQKVLDEAMYYVNFISSMSDESSNEVHLNEVQMLMKKYTISLDLLTNIMREGGHTIEDREDGPVMILTEESDPDLDEYIADGSDQFDDQFDDQLSLSNDDQSFDVYDTTGDSIFDDGNWNEESIFIVQNPAIPAQENSYLFDGQHPTEYHRLLDEVTIDLHVDDRSSRIDGAELGEHEVPRSETRDLVASDARVTNGAVEPDNNIPTLNTVNSSLQNSVLRDADVILNRVEINDDAQVASFQPYLSVSRSSTSPGLLFRPELDDSLLSQSLLSNTFNKPEVTEAVATAKPTTEATSIKTFPPEKKDEVDFSEHTPPNCFMPYCSSNIELNDVDSSASRVWRNENSLETELQDFGVCDGPQSTSSPMCKKVCTTQRVKRSCLEGDDLKNALESYTELNLTPTLNEAVLCTTDASEDTSQESSYNRSDVDTEIIDLRTTSDSESVTLRCETDADCSSGNNSQRELCSEENKSRGDRATFAGPLPEAGCNEEPATEENLIKHETDIMDVQSVADTHRVLSLDDKAREEYARSGSKAAVIKTYDDDAETRPRNGVDDLARPSISGESSSPFRELSNVESCNGEFSSSACAKENNVLDDGFRLCDEDTNNKVVQFASPLKSDENVGCDTKDSTSKDVNNTSSIAGPIIGAEAKLPSPTFESPPDSWSHEIVDSGYPNSASGQDITPENDLSSIAQDHIPDMESPSVAEAPRLGVLEPIEVENGDLANNNRDDEGNNMVAADANDIEGLQPLIDVLENDLENENDIYVMENGFPMWLLNLRVHHRVAADVHYMDHDEGFDSSSSDE